MKKILFLMLALSFVFGQVGFADVQIDEGQQHGQKAVKFFIGRVTQDTYISKDRVVVWDSTSKDGVTVKTTTTSCDGLVAGVTMDNITGVSSDNAASDYIDGVNFGRIQTWGIHEDVIEAATGTVSSAAGDSFCTNSTKGTVGDCMPVDPGSASKDINRVGVALETSDATAGTVDLFIKVD